MSYEPYEDVLMSGRLDEHHDEDVLHPERVSAQELDDQLLAAGFDPQALSACGEQLARTPPERLSWQEAARQKRASATLRATDLTQRRAQGLSRAALLAQLEHLRHGPGAKAAISTYFRDRQHAEFSDEELAALIQDLWLLHHLSEEN